MRNYGIRRILRDLVVLVVGFLVTLGVLAISFDIGATASGSTVEKRGVAVARVCVPAGLFGPSPWGWWETCQADVRWKDGTSERAEFKYSHLTSGDAGREVDVVKRREPNGKAVDYGHYRADFEPPGFILSSALTIPMLIGPITVLLMGLHWWSLFRPSKSAVAAKNERVP